MSGSHSRRGGNPPKNHDNRSFRNKAFLTIRTAAVVVIGALLVWKLYQFVLLLFAGVLLAIFLDALSSFVRDHTRLGWFSSVTAVILLLLALVGTGSYFLGSKVANQTTQLAEKIPDSIERIKQQLESTNWGNQLVSFVEEADLKMLQSEQFISRATGIFSTAVGAVTSFFLFLIFGLYLAYQPELYQRGLIRLIPPARRSRGWEVLHAVGFTLRWWLVGRIFSMTIVGIMTAVGLALLNIPFALTLGIIAAILTFVPFIGPIVSVVPAALLALLEGPMDLVYVLSLYVGIQFVESNFLTPLIQQRAVELPPVLTLSAQVVMGILAGVLGIILATPLFAATQVLVKMLYVEDTLGDKADVKGATLHDGRRQHRWHPPKRDREQSQPKSRGDQTSSQP